MPGLGSEEQCCQRINQSTFGHTDNGYNASVFNVLKFQILSGPQPTVTLHSVKTLMSSVLFGDYSGLGFLPFILVCSLQLGLSRVPAPKCALYHCGLATSSTVNVALSQTRTSILAAAAATTGESRFLLSRANHSLSDFTNWRFLIDVIPKFMPFVKSQTSRLVFMYLPKACLGDQTFLSFLSSLSCRS